VFIGSVIAQASVAEALVAAYAIDAGFDATLLLAALIEAGLVIPPNAGSALAGCRSDGSSL
jgi:hypothetical protein